MRTATRSPLLRTKILAWSLIPTVAVMAAIVWVSHFDYQAMAHDLVLEHDRELTRLPAEPLGSWVDIQPGDLSAHRRLPGNGHLALRVGLESVGGRVPRHHRTAAEGITLGRAGESSAKPLPMPGAVVSWESGALG